MKKVPREHTLKLLNQALNELEQELLRHQRGEGTIGDVHQLTYIQGEIKAMKENVELNNLPPKLEREQGGFMHVVLDSWPLVSNNKLDEILMAANRAYCEME